MKRNIIDQRWHISERNKRRMNGRAAKKCEKMKEVVVRVLTLSPVSLHKLVNVVKTLSTEATIMSMLIAL